MPVGVTALNLLIKTVETVQRSCGNRLQPFDFALEGRRVSQDVNVLALVKGEERFIFLYTDSNKSETLRTLGRFASDPELNFTWYDAAVLSQQLRQRQAATDSRVELRVPDSGQSWDD